MTSQCFVKDKFKRSGIRESSICSYAGVRISGESHYAAEDRRPLLFKLTKP